MVEKQVEVQLPAASSTSEERADGQLPCLLEFTDVPVIELQFIKITIFLRFSEPY